MSQNRDTRIEYDEEEVSEEGNGAAALGELRALKAREVARAKQQGAALARGRRKGKRQPLPFRFAWADLAQALGCSVRTVQRWGRQGRFDPRDFGSVARLLRETALF